MPLDPTEELVTTLRREEVGLDLFRQYRAVAEQIDRVQTQRYEDLQKLFMMAVEHIAALTMTEAHVEYLGSCRVCDHTWPCDTARAQWFIDRLDLESL